MLSTNHKGTSTIVAMGWLIMVKWHQEIVDGDTLTLRINHPNRFYVKKEMLEI